jgi:hypothetical protein
MRKATMPRLLKRICICTLILILCAGQAVAFDIQIGHLNFNPTSNDRAGQYQKDNDAFGARIMIPLGFSKTGSSVDTLNGQNLSRFTQEDAKDSLIVIMLFGVAIAVGVLTVSAASN